MNDVVWSRAARSDMLAIVAFIAEDNPDAAQILKNEVENKVANLALHSGMYRAGRVQGTREMVVRENYIVVYAEEPTRVRVLRILHAARQWP